jgi:hypothetical protein
MSATRSPDSRRQRSPKVTVVRITEEGAAGAGGERVNEVPKLPQARMYLQSAQWGFDELLRKQLLGYPFRFYVIGILTSLRAVQHALMHHDSTLSDEHKRVVEDWLQATPLSTPELHFIRTSRNLILKRGSFESYAIVTESSTGEEPNIVITGTSYELAYYDQVSVMIWRKKYGARLIGAIES